jgi:hypothetical protein
MTLRKVYIRYREDVPETEMFYAALEGFRKRGVETVPFHGFGDIEELDDLGPDVGLAGYTGDVWTALDKLGVERPPSLDYPDELKDFLGRTIERSRLKNVRNGIYPEGKFIKPVEQKLFTGFVIKGSAQDRIRLAPYDDEEEVWTSPAVKFVSEYRCFVLRGELIGVKHYTGDWAIPPERSVIQFALKSWRSKPAACTLDFGVVLSGHNRATKRATLLIEVNDGFAVGHYGLDSCLYAQVVEARWEELTRAL